MSFIYILISPVIFSLSSFLYSPAYIDTPLIISADLSSTPLSCHIFSLHFSSFLLSPVVSSLFSPPLPISPIFSSPTRSPCLVFSSLLLSYPHFSLFLLSSFLLLFFFSSPHLLLYLLSPYFFSPLLISPRFSSILLISVLHCSFLLSLFLLASAHFFSALFSSSLLLISPYFSSPLTIYNFSSRLLISPVVSFFISLFLHPFLIISPLPISLNFLFFISSAHDSFPPLISPLFFSFPLIFPIVSSPLLLFLLSSGLLSPSSFPASFQSFLQSEALEFFCTHCHKQISRLEDLSTRLQLLEMNR